MQQNDSGELPMPSSVPSQESSHPFQRSISTRRILWQSLGLYRRHGAVCLKQSLQASLWLILPLMVGLAGLWVSQLEMLSAIALWQWLLGGLFSLVGLTGYCIGSGQLSRWAWQQLQAQSAPDFSQAASAQNHAAFGNSSWRQRLEFGLLALKLSSISAGVLLLTYTVLNLLITVLFFIWTLSTGLAAIAVPQFPTTTVQHTAVIAIVLILLLFVLGVTWLMLRFLLHFFFAEAILMIRPVATAGSSLRQSWRLTRRSTRFLLRLAILIWLVTLPLQVPAQFVSWLLIVKLGQWLIPAPSHWLLQWLAVGVGSWLVGWLSLPLWQIAKAYLYQYWRNHQKLQDLQAEQQWWQV